MTRIEIHKACSYPFEEATGPHRIAELTLLPPRLGNDPERGA